MNKLIKICLVIGIVLIIFILLFGIALKINDKKKFNKIFNDFKEEHTDFNIKDRVYGNDESLIIMAISYYNNSTDSNSNVAIVTNKGIGYLDLAANNKDYTFANNERIKILDNNIVTVPLYNTKTNKIFDYKVIVTEDKLGTNYTIKSKQRDD